MQGWPQSGVELQSLAPAAAAAYGSSETVQLLNRNQSADVPLNVFTELAPPPLTWGYYAVVRGDEL